jgi:hypothetical protein
MRAPKPKRDVEDMLKQLGDPEEFAKQFPGGKIPRIPPEAMDDLTDAMFNAFLGGDGNEWARAPISRRRRRGPQERPETVAIREFVKDGLEPHFPKVTVRQAYYVIEVQGLVPKTAYGYTKVQRLLVKMRRNGDLSWKFIAEGTRWVRMRVSGAAPTTSSRTFATPTGAACGATRASGSRSGWRRMRWPRSSTRRPTSGACR